MFDASKLPRDVSQSTTEATWLLTTIFETTSAAAASKVETCSRWNVAFHMYPAANKSFANELWGWKFRGWPTDHKNRKNYIPQKFVHS